MKKITLLFLLLSIMSLGYTQKNVYPLPLDSGKIAKTNTLRYMLPTTGFKVTVSLAKVREIKGHYADYAEKLLGLTHVIHENKTYYRVKNVALEPIQFPDYTQAYLVELSAKEYQEIITQNAKNQIPTSQKPIREITEYCASTASIPPFFKNYSDPSYAEMDDPFVETKIIDGVVTQVPANHTKLISKTSDQKAQEASDAISKSRKDQYTLASGEHETAYPAETIGMMLKELKQWEENYLSLFTGLIIEDAYDYTFYITPDTIQNYPLFSFDPSQGISTDNLTGNNVYYLEFTPIFKDSYTQLTNISPTTPKIKKMGYRYREATPVQLKLTLQGKEINNFGNVTLSQYGPLKMLPTKTPNIDLNHLGFIF